LETTVSTAFNAPVSESTCTFCGQCVTVCPTGALTEKLPLVKSVPLAETFTDSLCTQCGVGCAIKYATHGELLLRALPGRDDSVLCAAGRFKQFDVRRITVPHIRKNGLLTKASPREVVELIKEQGKKFDPAQVAVAISGAYPNEVIAGVLDFAKKTLNVSNIYALKGFGAELPPSGQALAKMAGKECLPEINTQGLANAGVNMENGALEAAVSGGKVKVLFVFGDSVPVEWRDKIEFLYIDDYKMSPAAEVADVVMPFVAPFEASGMVTMPSGEAVQLK